MTDVEPSRVLFLFPGQGSQSVGMCQWLSAYPQAMELFQRAKSLLGWDVWEVCQEGPASYLTRTDVAQPAVFVTSLAVWSALHELAGAQAEDRVSFVGLGHSLGDYSALVACGLISFDDALTVVQERGQAMHECGEKQSGGMVAVLGLDDPQVFEVVSQVDDVWVANLNCPGQVVVSGTSEGLKRVVALVQACGGKSVPLKVSGAFHSPLMAAATPRVAAALERVRLNSSPIGEFVCSTEARPLPPSAVPESLVRQLTSAVRFTDAVRSVRSRVCFAIEVGPGRVLSGLTRRIDPTLTVFSTESEAGLHEAAAALANACGGRKQ